MRLKDYVAQRARLSNMDSEFSCPDGCHRFACKDERLHVSVSIIDVVAASLKMGQMVSDLFRSHYQIGSSPMDENPWIQRFVLELKKPCPFLTGNDCGIYGGRPYKIPHEAFEHVLARRLDSGGYLSHINSKVEGLNSPGGIEALYDIKERTDSIAASDVDSPYVYEFDEGNRLKLTKRPI